MPGLFIAENHFLLPLPPPPSPLPPPFPSPPPSPPIPLPIHQVSLIVCHLPSIFNGAEHHIDNKVVTYFPQDCITVTLPCLKFEPLDQLFLRTIYQTTAIPNFDIFSSRILCNISVWRLPPLHNNPRTKHETNILILALEGINKAKILSCFGIPGRVRLNDMESHSKVWYMRAT